MQTNNPLEFFSFSLVSELTKINLKWKVLFHGRQSSQRILALKLVWREEAIAEDQQLFLAKLCRGVVFIKLSLACSPGTRWKALKWCVLLGSQISCALVYSDLFFDVIFIAQKKKKHRAVSTTCVGCWLNDWRRTTSVSTRRLNCL